MEAPRKDLPLTPDQVDMILGLNSLIKVMKLGLNALGLGKPLLFVGCLSWILLNLVARVSVAFTGLTYSYDSANATSVMPGIVHISEKTQFWPLGFIEEQIPEAGAEFQTAHFYGECEYTSWKSILGAQLNNILFLF